MKRKKSNYVWLGMAGMLFAISLAGMLIFGYKTFYIESVQSEPTDYSYHFVLIGEERGNAYWQMIEAAAKQIAGEHQIYLEFIAPQKADNNQHLTLLDRTISAKVDGIITQGVAGERFIDLVHKGVERGIPVMTIDTDIKGSERKAYVGSDNIAAGKQLGEAFVRRTEGVQYVGIVTGRFEAVSQQERIEGFKQVIADHERIHIVAIEESNITEIGATTATYALLKRHPKINALIGMSAMDGMGIVEGMQEIAPNKHVFIATFDLLPGTISLMKQEKIDVAIAQYPREMGKTAVQLLMDLQQGDLLDNSHYIETKIITKENVSEYKSGAVN